MELAGDFLHVLGDGVAGEAATHLGDDFTAAGDGDLEVGGAADAVELVQVVGRDAAFEAPTAQIALRVGRVVDAGQPRAIGREGSAHHSLQEPG